VTIAVVDIGNATAGAGINNTALTAAINAIATTWYTDIMSGFTDSTSVTAIQAALLSRYSAMQHVDSHCYIGWEGSQGVLAGKLSGVNNQFLSVIGVTNPQDPTWRWSSALAGVAAAALVADPARQLRGLTLPNIIAPAIADRIYEPEQEALLAEGISTFDVAKNGSVQISRVVTTYTQSNLGVPDATWRDIMTAKVMTRIRWDWKNYLLLNYPRAKLSDDGSTAAEYDPSVVTPKRLQASWAARCKLYARAGWIENEDVTIAASVFARDPTDRNRVNSQRQLQIIGNNMVDAEQLLFAAQ
jgi:phage tail sheath gpL-like